MYSPQLSDLMDLVFFLKLFSIIALKNLKIPNTSDLCFLKYIQQNLEQSLIKIRKYLEPGESMKMGVYFGGSYEKINQIFSCFSTLGEQK